MQKKQEIRRTDFRFDLNKWIKVRWSIFIVFLEKICWAVGCLLSLWEEFERILFAV